ncbi:sigma factor [Aeromicrobium sp. CF3.5]|uniref:sigma factor n=1 Tax=Aeromicrobium sp. CF3.5 TaxID=3373078 RepID=UPI003EE5E220
MDASVRRLLEQTPLDAEQEHRLARRMRDGDVEARAALVMSGMRAVVQRALMFGLRGDDLRDGVQAGAVGLIQAVDRFDPDQGARLATYAWSWIGGAMRTPPRVDVPLPAQDGVAATRDESWTWIEGLDPPASEVLRLRHGVGGAAPMSRRQVAEHVGLSPGRVRAVETEAMRQLRVQLGSISGRAWPSCEADPP